ncbi:flagellar biosynthesis protein FliQ [Desulfatirhabdium butyrativorans]|uniref:flagellar biosynthesis protein FliQ n=1 Tax=Desulfatirhabdium butyrativorans TaxID=340467 RepID=UPI0003FAD709|nr:flagellar biosynthesis protein FliQ [Desulfatirhabdium butyrativorans]
MTSDFVLGFFWKAIRLAMLISAPALISGLVAGVLVSIFQAATQINESTLVFIPKMIAVCLALLLFFPWMLELMLDFTRNVLVQIPQYAR